MSGFVQRLTTARVHRAKTVGHVRQRLSDFNVRVRQDGRAICVSQVIRRCASMTVLRKQLQYILGLLS